MKAKTIAKRLRVRSDHYHRMAQTVQDGDKDLAVRHRLFADMFQEFADQITPRPKTSKKAIKKAAKKAAKAAKAAKKAAAKAAKQAAKQAAQNHRDSKLGLVSRS